MTTRVLIVNLGQIDLQIDTEGGYPTVLLSGNYLERTVWAQSGLTIKEIPETAPQEFVSEPHS